MTDNNENKNNPAPETPTLEQGEKETKTQPPKSSRYSAVNKKSKPPARYSDA